MVKIGKSPSSPEILATVEKNSEAMVSVVEKALTGKKYLVGETLTLADLFVVAAISRGYQFVSIRLEEPGLTSVRLEDPANAALGVYQEVGGQPPCYS